jgi:pimeloyl-ACP methyl ester carboxylesterase
MTTNKTLEESMTTDTTFVLVHAAWADSSSWAPVIGRLQQHGHHVVAAPLPLTSLADDTAALNRVLQRVQGPVVLAGHAYAGAVIGAVNTDTVTALVYIAAIAPEEGETVAELFHRAPAHPQAPELTPDGNGLIWLPQDAFATAFAQNATPAEHAMLAAVQRPLSPSCIITPAPRPAWKDLPSWFLIADNDRMIAKETQHFVATRMNATIRVTDADHLPMVTQPDSVIDILLAAANHPTAP